MKSTSAKAEPLAKGLSGNLAEHLQQQHDTFTRIKLEREAVGGRGGLDAGKRGMMEREDWF